MKLVRGRSERWGYYSCYSQEHAGPEYTLCCRAPSENDITWPPPAKPTPPGEGAWLWFIHTPYHFCPLPTRSLKLLSTSVWSLWKSIRHATHNTLHFQLNLRPSKEWYALLYFSACSGTWLSVKVVLWCNVLCDYSIFLSILRHMFLLSWISICVPFRAFMSR